MVPDRLRDFRVLVLGAERGRGVAGQRADPEEDEHARQEQDDEGGSDPSKEEAAHRLVAYFLNPAYWARISPSPKITTPPTFFATPNRLIGLYR